MRVAHTCGSSASTPIRSTSQEQKVCRSAPSITICLNVSCGRVYENLLQKVPKSELMMAFCTAVDRLTNTTDHSPSQAHERYKKQHTSWIAALQLSDRVSVSASASKRNMSNVRVRVRVWITPRHSSPHSHER